MEIISEPLPGLYLIKPAVHGDPRGHFFESYRQNTMHELGIKQEFVQDNQSLSNKNILRGLHYQEPPFAQDKLVRVIRGKVLDVVLDIRSNSPTYGRHYSVELSGDNFLMLLIPKGFAHGFYTMEDQTIFTYKCSNYYNAKSEGGILWNSPELAIQWNAADPMLSDKDKLHPVFSDFKSPF